jgi:DNA-binding PadR family transcriptional regulator
MEIDKLELVRGSKALNSRLFSLPRLLILDSLEEYGLDGATYREIKAGLDLDDGILYSSLSVLKKMHYLSEKKVRVENQSMTSYVLTSDGKQTLDEVKKWLKQWLER